MNARNQVVKSLPFWCSCNSREAEEGIPKDAPRHPHHHYSNPVSGPCYGHVIVVLLISQLRLHHIAGSLPSLRTKTERQLSYPIISVKVKKIDLETYY